MSHELRALIAPGDGCLDIGEAVRAVALPQGFVLVPITDDVFDRLGGGDEKPFGNVFAFLSGGIRSMAERLSSRVPIAYAETEFFGGTGTQAAVVWRDGSVVLGPLTHEFNWGGHVLPRHEWPVNVALAKIGVSSGADTDEFAALGLGRKRHTDYWIATPDG